MFDLCQGIGAVIKKVPGLSAVDSHDTEQQLATQTQSHGRLALADDVLHIIFQVRLQYILLCELALKVGGKPNACQRPGLGQERFGIKHVGV